MTANEERYFNPQGIELEWYPSAASFNDPSCEAGTEIYI
jgi:hypothetical protein